MSLETKNWKEFVIGDYFDVCRGKRIVKDIDFISDKIDDYTYPVVTASATNNSVDGYYNKSNCPGNSIVCGGDASGFFATYQEESCWVVDSSRIFIPKKEIRKKIDKYVCFFLITIFRKEMFKFSYGRKCNPNHIMKTKIKLPQKNDLPDWNFMSKYIKDIVERERERIKNLFNKF